MGQAPQEAWNTAVPPRQHEMLWKVVMHALWHRHCAQIAYHTFTLRTSALIRDVSLKRACAISGTRGTNGIGSVSREEIEGNNRQLTFRSRVMACMLCHHELTASPQWAFNTLRNEGSWLNCRWCLSDCCVCGTKEHLPRHANQTTYGEVAACYPPDDKQERSRDKSRQILRCTIKARFVWSFIRRRNSAWGIKRETCGRKFISKDCGRLGSFRSSSHNNKRVRSDNDNDNDNSHGRCAQYVLDIWHCGQE